MLCLARLTHVSLNALHTACYCRMVCQKASLAAHAIALGYLINHAVGGQARFLAPQAARPVVDRVIANAGV